MHSRLTVGAGFGMQVGRGTPGAVDKLGRYVESVNSSRHQTRDVDAALFLGYDHRLARIDQSLFYASHRVMALANTLVVNLLAHTETQATFTLTRVRVQVRVYGLSVNVRS